MIDGTNPALGDVRLDRLMAEVMAERAEDVYAAALPATAISHRIASRPRFLWVRQGARLGAQGSLALLVVGLLAALAVAAFVVGSIRQPSITAEMSVIGEVVEAVNNRDAEAFRSSLDINGAVYLPHVASDGSREVPRSGPYVVDSEFWTILMYRIEGWDMQADLQSCRAKVGSTIRCSVLTRWRTLQVEMVEEWSFDFNGTRVASLEMLRLDRSPPGRTLPLAYDDLQSWETWLEETHPDQAARFLGGSDLIWNFYFRYDTTYADEIGASIREYVETRP